MRKHQGSEQRAVPQFGVAAEPGAEEHRRAEEKPTEERANSCIPQFVSADQADRISHPNKAGWTGCIPLRAKGIKGESFRRVVVYVRKVKSVVVNGTVDESNEQCC